MIQLTFIQFNLIINKIPFLSSLKKKKKEKKVTLSSVFSQTKIEKEN